MNVLTSRFGSLAGLIFSTCLALPFFPAQAHAANVTVSGITYDIQIASGTFASNEALLKNTPWWGTTTDNAQRYALDYRDQVGTSTFASSTSGFNFLAFATTSTFGYVLYQDGRMAAQSFNDSTYFAYIPRVPEINASSLSQALLILMALWLVLRRRGASFST